jgi:hypothetical protein
MSTNNSCNSFRRLLLQHPNIVTILFNYFVEAAHAAGLLICLSTIYVLTIGPMSFFLAQSNIVIGSCLVDVMFLMGGSISLFKILLVTHFDLVFDQDPEQLGQLVLGFSLLAICIPHVLNGVYQSVSGVTVAPIVSFLMGKPPVYAGASSPMIIFEIFWFALSILLLIVAKLYIPYHLNRHQTLAVQAGERKDEREKKIPMAAVIFGCLLAPFVVIVNVVNQSQGFVGQLPVEAAPVMASLIIWLMLTVLALNKKVRGFIKEEIIAESHKARQALHVGCVKSSRISPA